MKVYTIKGMGEERKLMIDILHYIFHVKKDIFISLTFYSNKDVMLNQKIPIKMMKRISC